jgi:hypothetical protein
MKKVLLGILIATGAALGAVFWWLQANLDDLIGKAIARHGSEMTGAKVSVGSVELSAKEGRAIVRNLTIGNPAGFKTAHALQVQEVELAIDLSSVRREVVLVRKILVQAPDIIFEKSAETTNIGVIRKNIASYRNKNRAAQPGDTRKASGEAKKLIIGELKLAQANAHASATFMQGKTLGLKLPDIMLLDLGKDKGGVPPGELGYEIAQALERQLLASFNFEEVPKPVGDAVDKAVDKAKDALKSLLSK